MACLIQPTAYGDRVNIQESYHSQKATWKAIARSAPNRKRVSNHESFGKHEIPVPKVYALCEDDNILGRILCHGLC